MREIHTPETLEDLSAVSRRIYAEKLFTKMADGDIGAQYEFAGLVDMVIRDFRDANDQLEDTAHTGEFSSHAACGFLYQQPRVTGYLSALRSEPTPESVIDLGTGPGALLALASAVYHQPSRIDALEINYQSVLAARKVAELYGLADEVEIHHVDAETHPLEEVDLCVTETFGQVLTSEPGVKLQRRYGQVARRLLPAAARVYASATFNGEKLNEWQEAGYVDFRTIGETYQGEIQFDWRRGEDPQFAFWTGLLTEEGGLLIPYAADEIATAVRIPNSFVPEPSDDGKAMVTFEIAHSTEKPFAQLAQT